MGSSKAGTKRGVTSNDGRWSGERARAWQRLALERCSSRYRVMRSNFFSSFIPLSSQNRRCYCCCCLRPARQLISGGTNGRQ